MEKFKKTKIMPMVKLERDIEQFLQKVEIELNKIFKSYSAPARKVTELGMMSYSIYSEIKEKAEKKEIPHPWDLYQAQEIISFVEQARLQLSQNDCQGLAYSVGSIIQIIAAGDKFQKRHAGKQGEGYEGLFTLFIKDLIDYTRKQNPGFKSTDVINSLEDFYDQNHYKYKFLEVDVIDGEIKFSEYGADFKPIKQTSLVSKINFLNNKSK